MRGISISARTSTGRSCLQGFKCATHRPTNATTVTLALQQTLRHASHSDGVVHHQDQRYIRLLQTARRADDQYWVRTAVKHQTQLMRLWPWTAAKATGLSDQRHGAQASTVMPHQTGQSGQLGT